MTKENDLGIGFSDQERERISLHFKKLFPYLKPGEFVLVGGLVIRYHLLSHGIDYPLRKFNDLDLMVKSPDVVSRAVSKDFMIYHYHPNGFYLALVDPETKVKVDIFNYTPPPFETTKVMFGGTELEIRTVEDQLVKTVFDTQRISESAKVDPKQFLDARLLAQIADMDKADKFWELSNFPDYPKSIQDAIKRSEQIAKTHPEWLKDNPFKKTNPYQCAECKSSDGFTLTPMEDVFKVLGYIE